VTNSFGRLPLRFEENRGQFHPRARFVARNGGLTLFLTDEGALMTLHAPSARPIALSLKVAGAPAHLSLEARGRLSTRTNYFLGNDPKRWRADVPSFGEVVYRGVRPGVDLVYHGASGGRLEYDFVIAPGASPDVVLDVQGAEGLRVDGDGALEIRLADGVLHQAPPTVYQIVNGQRRVLRARYRVVGGSRVGFAVADYDRSRQLVIDPVLLYSTYLGGSGDDFAEYQAAVDGDGSMYVVGYTSSTDFPTKNPLVPSHVGGTYDGFIAKLTPAGDALAYSTYLGGSSEDYVYGVAVDGTGAAYVAGMTNSDDFPTKNPMQTHMPSVGNSFDAFVTKLTPAGDALVYSTYLGGHGYDRANCIAIDGGGAAYVAGETYSTDFPTVHPIQASYAGGPGTDGFVAKLNADGSALAYATYLGGHQNEFLTGVAVDPSGAAVVSGTTASTDFPVTHAIQSTLAGTDDAYVAKLSLTGDALIYSTYLGGSGEDYAYAVAVDGTGAAYVTGQTASANFPTANPIKATVNGTDAFVAKLAPDGSALVYSTFLGGSTTDWAYGLAVDASGAAYVAGSTLSSDFPVVNAIQSSNASVGIFDAFVTKLTPAGTGIAFSTYLGGTSDDEINGVAVDGHGAVYAAGWTHSKDFPIVGGFQSTFGSGSYHSFVAKIGYPPLVITPVSATLPPRGGQTFVASGGSGGYSWALTTNASGGTVDTSGNYTAGATGSVVDVLTLTDSANAVATATITVTAGVTVTPASASVGSGEHIAFTASGGSGTGYAWTLDSVPDGVIDGASGMYVAGSTSGADRVRVVDSLGNSATATVTILASPADDLGAADLGAGDLGATDLGAPGESPDLAMQPPDQGPGTPPSGCSCQLGGARPASAPAALILLVLATALLRRRTG
jgi:MYXO-CTERM domain-containing protein